jgi:light-regulated signal transduction histidine kinase (bacteriophytochrome)
MLVLVILCVSVVLQLMAAISALRLIRTTNRSLAWGLISTALLLMAVRRLVSLYLLSTMESAVRVDLANEIVGLLLSTAMLAGILRIEPLFLERLRATEALRASEEDLRRLNQSLEQRVQGRTAELEASNQEIAAFSYSVSHDLRAPLRTIDGFSLALLEDYADKLDADGQDYLRRIRSATQRMGTLIDDMLRLSRITRAEMMVEHVDLSELARSVTRELLNGQPERSVKVEIADGLAVTADRKLMHIVLENLLSNAWKFTGKRAEAVVEVGATSTQGTTAYFVRDNGAGFDMAYAGKLFTPFQRLHSVEEFPGTGIGLGTVQRIMQRHGGTVWAEGQVGQGAAFYFSFEKAKGAA